VLDLPEVEDFYEESLWRGKQMVFESLEIALGVRVGKVRRDGVDYIDTSDPSGFGPDDDEPL
jgi:hypothetical protein